ncbi:MAG TPA: bZIP transcription factor [Vicinamibacteria bacterium]|nr:bZIP transcription factor [Vicinamibacteria bacterium]
MTDRFEELERRVEALTREMRRLDARLDRLEARRAREPAKGPPPAPAPEGVEVPSLPREAPQGTLALAGRTIVAMGGGYLIRALTEAGVLPVSGGVALGLGYALLWLAMADRAAGVDRRASATYHGVASGLIAYPLLWETTTRFGLLGPPAALAVLVLVFGAGMAVAARRRLGAVAWVVTALALGTAVGLMLATHHLLAVVLSLLAIAAVVECLAFRDLWLGLRGPAALALDSALLVLVLLASRPGGLPEHYPALRPGAAIAAALGLVGVYLASIVARTLGRRCPVTPFELAQGPVALALGFAGAWALLARGGTAATALGGAVLLLGALCYATAFAFVERRKGQGRNFYFYSTIGGLLTLAGSRAILGAGALALAWCLLALASAWLGMRFGRRTLRFHGALYVGAAALENELLASSWRGLFAGAGTWSLPAPAGWLSALTALGVYAVLAPGGARTTRGRDRLPEAVVAVICAWIAGGTLVAAWMVAVPPPAAAAAAVVATVRTGVLAVLALACGWAARRWALPELGWLVYPLLAIGGLKLVTEDLREGRPATLFLSLVLYGGALIAAPRLMRREG